MVERLANRPESVEWKEKWGSRFDGELSGIKVYIVESSSDFDPEADPDYLFGFVGPQDATLDYVSDTDLKPYLPNSYSVMRTLFQAARRKANNIASIVDELNKALDNEI
ncbi:hypothetical protein D9M72_496160 [compost metagenome]